MEDINKDIFIEGTLDALYWYWMLSWQDNKHIAVLNTAWNTGKVTLIGNPWLVNRYLLPETYW
jgi:hypothetical protein